MQGNLSIENLYKITLKIVESEFPTEKGVFGIYGEEQIIKCLDGKNILSNKNDSALHEFGDSIVEVFKFLSVIAGTIKSVMELIKVIKKKKNSSKVALIKTVWEKDLVDSGLTESQAQEIVKKFIEDFDKTFLS